MQIPLTDKAYTGQSAAFESSRSVNLYAELADSPNSKGQSRLVGTPGLKYLGVGANGPARALYSFNGELFAIFQSDFMTVDTSSYPWKVKQNLGAVNSSSSNIVIRDNGLLASGLGGNQLLIVDGVNGYIFDVLTRKFSTLPTTTGGFPAAPIDADFIDGYFIVIGDSMQAASSDLYDGTTFNGLAVADVMGTSSKLKAVKCNNETIYFIKEDSMELWQNIGTPTSQGFPFQRVSGAVINYGTMAGASWSKAGMEIIGIGGIKTDSGVQFDGVVRVNGYMPQVITSPAIRFAMGSKDNLGSCFAYVYSESGHTFYVLTNPVDNWTFVYDLENDFWHERSTYVGSPYEVGRHMAGCYAYHNGMHIVGDANGNLFELNSDYRTDGGLPICSMRVLQPVFDKKDLKPFSISELTIDSETGVGTGPIQATATCYIDGSGGISSVVVSDGGADYLNNDPPTVTAIPIDGQGSGAVLTPVMANGSVQSVTVTSAGSGYNFPPQIVFSNPIVPPSLVLSWSTDGAKTWGGEYSRPLGSQGERIPSPHWNRLGYADNSMVFRIMCSDACKKSLMGAYVE